MAEVGKLNVKITADIKDLQKKLKQSQTMVKTAAKKIGTLSIKMDISSLEKSGKKASTTFKDVTSGASSLISTTSGLIRLWDTASGALGKKTEKLKQSHRMLLNELGIEATGATAKKTLLLLRAQMGLAVAKGNLFIAKKLGLSTAEAAANKVTAASSLVESSSKNLATASTWGLVIAQNALLAPILAIVAVAAVFVGAFLLFTKNARELRKENRELTKSLDESKQAFEDQQKEVGTSAGAARGMADQLFYLEGRIQKLREAGKNTDDELAEMYTIIGALNEQFPDLNLSVDEQTGLLKGNTDELKKNIEAQIKMLEVQARQERIVEIYKEQFKLQQQIEKVEKQYRGDKEKAREETEKLRDAYDDLDDELEDHIDVISDYNELTEAGAAAREKELQRIENSEIDLLELEKEIYAEKHMTIEDYYAEIAKLQNSSQADAREQIKEHLEEIDRLEEEKRQDELDRQKDIEDEKQEHLDRLFRLKPTTKTNQELLDEVTTGREIGELWAQNIDELLKLEGVPTEMYDFWQSLGPEYANNLGDWILDYLKEEQWAMDLMEEVTKGHNTAGKLVNVDDNVLSAKEDRAEEERYREWKKAQTPMLEMDGGVGYFGTAAEEVGNEIPKGFTNAQAETENVLNGLFGSVLGITGAFLDPFGTAVGLVTSGIPKEFSKSKDESETVLGEMPITWMEKLLGSKEPVRAAAGEMADGVTEEVTGATDEAGTAIGGLPSFIASLFSGSKKPVKAAAGEMADGIPEEVSGVKDKLGTTFKEISDLSKKEMLTITKAMKSDGTKIANTVIETISDSMRKKVKELFPSIKFTGGMFMLGLASGLAQYQHIAFARAAYIALRIASIIRGAWEVRPPSQKVVGLPIGGGLSEMSGGLARGMTDQMQSTFNSYGNTSSSVNNNTYNTTYQSATSNNDGANMADFENRIRRAYG